MFSLRAIKNSLSSSYIASFCKKWLCKVNQSLFEGWDQQRRPQIVVLEENGSRLDSTQTENVLNATWKIKPKPNRNPHGKQKTKPKPKNPNSYIPISKTKVFLGKPLPLRPPMREGSPSHTHPGAFSDFFCTWAEEKVLLGCPAGSFASPLGLILRFSFSPTLLKH